MLRACDLLALDDAALLAQCDLSHKRGSGKGGQKRNKTSNAVMLRHRESGICAEAGDRRSLEQNKALALKRLRRALAFGLRSELDPKSYRPSQAVQRFCSGSLSDKRREYYLAIAEVLDLIAAHGAQMAESAKSLHLSTSKLSKRLASDPLLLGEVNRLRDKVGFDRLRG